MFFPTQFAVNGVLERVVMISAVRVELKGVGAKFNYSIIYMLTTFNLRHLNFY
jgi:hypothetical protein